jgi:hypothetical protein
MIGPSLAAEFATDVLNIGIDLSELTAVEKNSQHFLGMLRGGAR